jgi:LacI family transcriptional regulator
MSKPNIKDVAKEAGVSIATVSHVINSTRFVREETQQKVLQAIETLHYQPNAIARSLVTNSTQKIGLVISDITNPFFTAVARGVEDVINQHRYNTFFCNTDEDPEREEEYLRLLTSQQIDGLIIAPTGIHSEPLIQMAKVKLPIVLLDRTTPHLKAPLVAVNNEAGAYQAIRYLLTLGHQRIAFLGSIDTISTQQDRFNGFKLALQEAGLPLDENLVVQADPRFYGTRPDPAGSPLRPAPENQSMPSAYDVLRELLQQTERPSAIFVASNQLTIGTLYAFRECGLKCPEDISLISFDDHDWAPLFSPPLTVVRQPTYRLGQMAATLLMKLIKGERVKALEPLPIELIVRGSCQPISPNGSYQQS